MKFWAISTIYLETCCIKKYLDVQVGVKKLLADIKKNIGIDGF